MKTITVLLIALTLALSSCATTTPITEDVVIEPPKTQTSTETTLENTQNIQEDIPTTSQTDVPEPSHHVEELEKPVEEYVEEPIEEMPTLQNIIEPGTPGQAGGVVFVYNEANLEEFVIDTDGMSYAEALTISQNCTMITNNESYSDWRLPSTDELLAIYSQLFETGLVEFEETYYWAASTEDSDTAPVVYFGTGFETEFYKDMDFVGLIVVRNV